MQVLVENQRRTRRGRKEEEKKGVERASLTLLSPPSLFIPSF